MRKNFNSHALSQGITRCMWFPFEGFAYIIQFQMESFGSQIAGNMSFSQNFTPLIPIPAYCQKVFYLPKWELYTFCGGFWCMGLMLYTKNVIPDYKHYLSDVIAYHETRVISIPTLLLWNGSAFCLSLECAPPRPLCTNTFSTSNPAASKTILKPDAF